MLILIDCEHCGTPTEKTRRNKRYCSKKCADAGYLQGHLEQHRQKLHRYTKMRSYNAKRYAYEILPENLPKTKARRGLFLAKSRGEIDKPTSCPRCSRSDLVIEGHHYKGYEKENWLEVEWLCQQCHREEHK